MKNKTLIPYLKFVEAFEKVGWKQQANDGRYTIFADPKDAEVWTRIPKSEKDPDYASYVDRNIRFLLFALSLPEDEENVDDLSSQLKSYNYKLLNRIIAKAGQDSSIVPFELANYLPEKNIGAFRYFYHMNTKTKKKTIPIERFEFSHTEVGSFVIPISIKVIEDDPNTQIPMQSDMNLILHKYLAAVEKMSNVPRTSAVEFADRIMADEVDSKIVKDFFGADNSIARYKKKYEDTVDAISIGSRGSALLDFNLPKAEQSFPEVDLGALEPIKEEFIETLEDREIKADNSSLDMHNVKVDVLVNGINDNGKAQFTVVSIDDTEVSKPFKASSVRLAKAQLDMLASKFINGGTISMLGDVAKAKGRMGEILIDSLVSGRSETPEGPGDKRLPLFE